MNNLGCIFLENGINFEYNRVSDCCIYHHFDRGQPLLIDNYGGELIDWEKIFEIKSQRIKAQKEKTIYECQDCYHLGKYNFSGEKKISEFHFSHCRSCNASCIYCSEGTSRGSVNYSTYPIIKDLMEKGYYKAGGEATFQGGEPTLMQNFDELVSLFIENGTDVRIHSSGIKYSQKIREALDSDKGKIVISLDSGTSETYKKIKGVDSFNLVCGNIEKYAQNGVANIIIKYIIIPGVNDNIKEIDKFFKLMNSLNIKNIALDIELQYAEKNNNKDVSKHIYLIKDYFEAVCRKYNKNLIIYSFLIYVLQYRNIKKTFLINNKFLFSLYLYMCNNKSKNIKYKR